MKRIVGLVLVVAAVVLPGMVHAQGCNPDEDALACFNRAFQMFCAAARPQPSLCAPANAGAVGHRWLLISDHCSQVSGDPGCRLFDAARAKDPNPQPTVLAYDHPSGTWAPRNALSAKRVKQDVAGVPTVSLDPKEELVVMVENTNPLLYTLAAGVATEANIPELAELQRLAGLLGGSTRSLLNVIGTKAAADAQAGLAIDDYVTALKRTTDDLSRAGELVRCLGQEGAERSAEISNFIQRVELGQQGEYALRPPTCPSPPNPPVPLEPASVALAFQNLHHSLRSAASDLFNCTPLLEPASRLVSGDPTKPATFRQAIADFNSARLQLVCGHDDLVAGLELQRDAVENALNTNTLPAFLQTTDAKAYATGLAAAIGLTNKHATMVELGNTLLKERDNARKAIARLVEFDSRLPRFLSGGAATACADAARGCISTDQVSRYLLLPNDPGPVRWEKIQSHSIVLTAGSPFASTVAANKPAPVTVPYLIDSTQRGLFGIGASVIYTPLTTPTFGVVTKDSQKVIAITDEETRAGELALLLDYRLGRRWCPSCRPFVQALGVEFGAALDTNKPGFFGGVSLRMGKYVRLGAGLTSQKVKDLKGQKLGDVVASADDIKKRDKFDHDYYISLSVAFESLKLFSSGN